MKSAGTSTPHAPFPRIRTMRLQMDPPCPVAKAAGVKAWYRGDALASNPNVIGTPEYVGWEAGYMDAERSHR